MAKVEIVTRDEMLDEIKGILEDENMTLEEFIAEGQADALTGRLPPRSMALLQGLDH